MSGAEVLGILGGLAAASQLAQQSLKVINFISDLYGKVRDAPESIRKQAVQVEQLVDIARLIEHNPSLQTDAIISILQSCQDEAQQLLDILWKVLAVAGDGKVKRLWKAVDGFTREKKILEHLRKLEQEKTSLALCIVTIDSALLHTVHLDLVTVKICVDEVSKELPAIRDTTRNVTTIIGALPGIINDITGIHEMLPDIAGNITTVHDELSGIQLKVTAIHDVLPAMQEAMEQLSMNQQGAKSSTFREAHTYYGGQGEPNTLSEVSDIATDLQGKLPGVATKVERILNFMLNQKVSPSCTNKNYYLVPNRRVRDFVGREDVLGRIKRGFLFGSRPRVVVIRGPGGQGKSQVALEHCHRAKVDNTRAIFWVDAMTENTLRKSLETIAERIKSPGVALQDDTRVDFVLESFRDWPERWLMVFDNYDDPKSFPNLQDFVPMGEHGNILITTRHADAVSLAERDNAIELHGLEEKEALCLLFRQCRVKEMESHIQHGKVIVKRLGYHPLAITQAGSYILHQKIDVTQFMDHYDRRRHVILNQTPQMSQYRRKLNEGEKETALNVFTTWELSFQQLKDEESGNKRIADILMLFAFFDCNDISEQLFEAFRNGDEHLSTDAGGPKGSLRLLVDSEGRWDSDAFVDILNKLAHVSLVQTWWREKEDGYSHLSLHPLVKDWTLLRTDWKSSQEYFLTAAQILAALIRSCDKYGLYGGNFPLSTSQLVLSHIDAHEENMLFFKKNLDMSTPDSFWIALASAESKFVAFLTHRGRYREAERVGRRLLEQGTEKLGLEHTDTLTYENLLAGSLFYQSKNDEATMLLRHVLEGREKLLGPMHRESVESLNNLAIVLGSLGKHGEAEEMLRSVIDRCENGVGQENPEVPRSFGILGQQLERQGKYEDAKVMYQRVVEGYQRLLGPEHPHTLSWLSDLSRLLETQEEYEAALPLYQEAFSGLQKVLGPDHPETLKTYNIYSAFLQKLKDVAPDLV